MATVGAAGLESAQAAAAWKVRAWLMQGWRRRPEARAGVRELAGC